MLWIGAAVAVLAVGYTLAFFTRDIRFKRSIRSLGCEPIAAVREGRVVKIVGKVIPAGDILSSPGTQRPCVYYHAWHEVLRPVNIQGARTDEWAPAGEEEDACDFHVADESGTAVVRVRGDRPQAALRADAYVELRSDDGMHRSHEAVLAEGARVAVIGVASREIDAEAGGAGYRDAPTRVVLRAPEGRPLVISDDPAVVGA